MTDDFADRHHDFEGCFNFRDIGGYQGSDGRRLRWGQYFRAGRQDRMTAADLERVGTLSIATQIDLRRPEEVRDQGQGPLQNLGTSYEAHAVIPEGGSKLLDERLGAGMSGERYLNYLAFDPAPWHRIFGIFADTNRYPMLIHCTAGKDRTGVITAMLLSVLGVERQVIEQDYALTNRDVSRQVDFVVNGPGIPEGATREMLTLASGVPPEAIGVFLDGLDKEYGGPLSYLRSIGINDVIFDAMRGAMLEPV